MNYWHSSLGCSEQTLVYLIGCTTRKIICCASVGFVLISFKFSVVSSAAHVIIKIFLIQNKYYYTNVVFSFTSNTRIISQSSQESRCFFAKQIKYKLFLFENGILLCALLNLKGRHGGSFDELQNSRVLFTFSCECFEFIRATDVGNLLAG